MKKSKTKYIFNRAVALVLTAAMLVTGAAGCAGGGIEAKAATGNGIITDERLNELNETYFKDKEYNRVSVHDPSIVTGYIDEKNYTGSEHVYGV